MPTSTTPGGSSLLSTQAKRHLQPGVVFGIAASDKEDKGHQFQAPPHTFRIVIRSTLVLDVPLKSQQRFIALFCPTLVS